MENNLLKSGFKFASLFCASYGLLYSDFYIAKKDEKLSSLLWGIGVALGGGYFNQKGENILHCIIQKKYSVNHHFLWGTTWMLPVFLVAQSFRTITFVDENNNKKVIKAPFFASINIDLKNGKFTE